KTPALLSESLADRTEVMDSFGLGLRDGKDKAYKSLSALKPEDRKSLLRNAKLSPEVLKQLSIPKAQRQTARPYGPNAQFLEVQICLNNLPPDGMAKLKALGFKLSATVMPNKLVLGTADLDKLDSLLELPWVRRVEIPKYK